MSNFYYITLDGEPVDNAKTYATYDEARKEYSRLFNLFNYNDDPLEDYEFDERRLYIARERVKP